MLYNDECLRASSKVSYSCIDSITFLKSKVAISVELEEIHRKLRDPVNYGSSWHDDYFAQFVFK